MLKKVASTKDEVGGILDNYGFNDFNCDELFLGSNRLFGMIAASRLITPTRLAEYSKVTFSSLPKENIWQWLRAHANDDASREHRVDEEDENAVDIIRMSVVLTYQSLSLQQKAELPKSMLIALEAFIFYDELQLFYNCVQLILSQLKSASMINDPSDREAFLCHMPDLLKESQSILITLRETAGDRDITLLNNTQNQLNDLYQGLNKKPNFLFFNDENKAPPSRTANFQHSVGLLHTCPSDIT